MSYGKKFHIYMNTLKKIREIERKRKPRRQFVPFYLLEDQPDQKLLNMKLDLHRRVSSGLVPDIKFFNSLLNSSLLSSRKRNLCPVQSINKKRQRYLSEFTEGQLLFNRTRELAQVPDISEPKPLSVVQPRRKTHTSKFNFLASD